MNFKPELCAKVVDGTKTVTRRPTNGKPCQYVVWGNYAVCPGQGKHQVARMVVLDVRKEPVGAITDAEAVLEGFAGRDEFVAYWRKLYRGEWDPDLPVWRIEFKLISRSPAI